MNRIIRWLTPAASYAEIHYTPLPGISLLSHSWPEILADVPFRIEPGACIPVLILIKDAERFPLRLHRVRISLQYDGGLSVTHCRRYHNTLIRDHCWHITEYIQPESGYSGNVDIRVEFDVERNGRYRTFRQHNYRRGGNHPLRVYLAADPLPCCPG